MTPCKRRTSFPRKRWHERRVQWGGGFALLDPLLRRPTLVVEVDDGPIRPGQGRDDEDHLREELSQMMLDLSDNPPRAPFLAAVTRLLTGPFNSQNKNRAYSSKRALSSGGVTGQASAGRLKMRCRTRATPS